MSSDYGFYFHVQTGGEFFRQVIFLVMKYLADRFIVPGITIKLFHVRHIDERKKKDLEESVEESVSNNELDVELQVSEDSGDGELIFH